MKRLLKAEAQIIEELFVQKPPPEGVTALKYVKNYVSFCLPEPPMLVHASFLGKSDWVSIELLQTFAGKGFHKDKTFFFCYDVARTCCAKHVEYDTTKACECLESS